MNKLIKLVSPPALAAAFFLALAPNVEAQQARIGTLDLKKVFDGYYKTRQADGRLKEDASAAEKVLKNMLDDYQKANEDYKKLIESANDQAVSSEERDRRKKSSEQKLTELQEIERQVGQYRRDTTERLELQKRRMREDILRQIREIITAKARTAGYTMVVDTAADSFNQTPILLYNSGQNDMTEEILTEINRNAPPGSLTPAAPEAKPDGAATGTGSGTAPATKAAPGRK